MANPCEFDSASLFTPGRGSYITTSPEDGTFKLNLTAASLNRANAAAQVFHNDYHTLALFAGGYPGIAQNWPVEHTPALGHREANLMALPLKQRLASWGWNDEAIAEKVKEQDESTGSIGDVLISIKRGFLDPDDFHGYERHGIEVVAGSLHASRFRAILMKALDIDPKLIRRIDHQEYYGTPATEFRPKEPSYRAVAKELAAICITKYVLQNVRPGNLEDLSKAERKFNAIAAKVAR